MVRLVLGNRLTDALKQKMASPSVTRYPVISVKGQPWPANRPLISVIIPCHDYGQYLPQAIESVLQQTLQDFELIIVDDGSTDPLALAVLDQLDHPKITLYRQMNQGPSAARNLGISKASGRYICCLDADDHLAPTYLEKCVILLEANQGVRLAYTWVQLVGDETRVVPSVNWHPDLLRYVNFLYISAVFYREDWCGAGGFQAGDHEDWDFWIHLATLGIRGQVIPEPLFFYRKHGRTRGDDGNEHLYRVLQTLRERYPDFYSSKTCRQRLIMNYQDELTDEPMMNLSRPEQYRSEPIGVYIEGVPGYDLVDRESCPETLTVIAIVSDVKSMSERWRQRVNVFYELSFLLHERQWPAFCQAFIASHVVQCLFSDRVR